MNWRTCFYIFSLIVLWGFLISGAVVRKEELDVTRIKNDLGKYWNYYLMALFMPQIFIILATLQVIFDFGEFKEMFIGNYKRS